MKNFGTLEYVLDKYSRSWSWKITGIRAVNMVSRLIPQSWYGDGPDEAIVPDNNDNVQQIKASKGKKSLWPEEAFQHDFEDGAEVLGIGKTGQYKLNKGDLVIRSRKGKRLWKNFDY